MTYLELDDPSVALDLRAMKTTPGHRDAMAAATARAFDELAALEAGAIANPDEGRQVGHYWLRDPGRAPTPTQAQQIRDAAAAIEAFVAGLDGRFGTILSIGIGGSALGPQLVADALGSARDRRRVLFIDNIDPDGVARTLARASDLDDTLVLVISKSGRTPETRHGYDLVRAAYERAGVDFPSHAVAVTGVGSELHDLAGDWLARLPMWDWVGGRTSVTSAVGILPAALQGLDTGALLAGAAAMDARTRVPDVRTNPAASLALAWHDATGGRAARAMVVLPYNDRLVLMSRYLQQLIMESLGKQHDRAGNVVHQGLTVYGNKGSTDQHAYVQQLRGGPDDFFAAFIEVLEDGGDPMEVAEGVRAGDLLSGFLAGTRRALQEAGRRSLTITVPRVDAFHLGALIALFERAVSLYASLVDINAYHQPGVEAGKRAAGAILDLQARLLIALDGGAEGDADGLAAVVNADPTDVFHVLRHLAANGRVTAVGKGLGRRFTQRA